MCLRASLPVIVRQPQPSDPAQFPPLSSQLPDNAHPAPLPSLPILDFIASDESLDRYSEIISPAGWKLDTYRRNPIFQNCHQYGDIIFTLGKALITELRTSPPALPPPASDLEPSARCYLFQRIQFAVDANPLARIAFNLYHGGFLNAVSVGFIPLRWEDADTPPDARNAPTDNHSHSNPAQPPSPLPPPDHRSLITDHPSDAPKPRRRYLEQELLEVSAVAIPANPNALALAVKSGAVEKSHLLDTLDLLRSISSALSLEPKPTPHDTTNPTSASTNSPTPPPSTPNLKPLLALSREISLLLKHL